MDRTEFQWDGDDFPSVYDRFVPLVPPRPVVAHDEEWAVIMSPGNSHAMVATPDGTIIANVRVHYPYRTPEPIYVNSSVWWTSSTTTMNGTHYRDRSSSI